LIFSRLRVTITDMQGLECVGALKALSEETRLRILRAVSGEPLDVSQIAERLSVSPYNVSKHLRVLRDAGLLQVQRQGKRRLYSLTPTVKGQLATNQNVLDLGCCTFRFDQLPQ
jgi:DNA-binding transcriptional ArsR family regulator